MQLVKKILIGVLDSSMKRYRGGLRSGFRPVHLADLKAFARAVIFKAYVKSGAVKKGADNGGLRSAARNPPATIYAGERMASLSLFLFFILPSPLVASFLSPFLSPTKSWDNFCQKSELLERLPIKLVAAWT